VKIVVVVQARTGSTRLPGKVLLPAAGASLLERMLERVCAASRPSEVVVATTRDPADDAIVEVARKARVGWVRGHATDLLERHLDAARATDADVVVKIPSDCPLIDPAVIDRVIDGYLSWAEMSAVDFVSNLHPPTWPDGFDVEAVARGALELAGREATKSYEREHTTPFIWDHPERFVTRNVCWECGFDYSKRYRLTLDYPEDYAVIRGVYEDLYSPRRVFTLPEILAVLEARPALRAKNAMHVGSSWYRHHPGELKTIGGHA
jgi:spore coat polysaccharide biosynthesis protein SpsF